MRDKVKQRAAWRKWYREHKDDQDKKEYFRRNKRRAKVRDWFISLKATLFCRRCGFDNPAALDFHHKDPKDKEFTIGDAIAQTLSIPRIKREIAKCEVLCANCHRIEHRCVAQLG